MFQYTYPNTIVEPYLDGIHNDVSISTMANKNIHHCNWDSGTQNLDIFWDVELSVDDKAKLDTIVSNNSTVPILDTKIEVIFKGSVPPIDKDMSWLNSSDGVLYIWDSDRNKWRTTFNLNFTFAFDGEADNDYLKIMTVYGSSTAYLMPKNAVITSIACRASGGNSSKEFKIKRGDVDTFSFSLSGSIYDNTSTNVDLIAGDELKIHCESDGGGAVENPIINLEVAWRY